MNNIVHHYFGKIEADVTDYEVVWEGELHYKEEEIPVDLWLGQEDKLSGKKLDAFAEFLEKFAEKEVQARAQILHYLQNTDQGYFQYHVEKMQEEVPQSLPAFVEALELMAVSLWHTPEQDEASDIVVDYMIDPNESEEILAVHFRLDGSIAEVAWES